MKLLIVLFAVLMSSSVFAQSTVITHRDNPELLGQYKEAVVSLLKVAQKYECRVNETRYWSLVSSISNADAVTVTEGSQPLLTFTEKNGTSYYHGYSSERFENVKIQVTTTSDYKKIVSVLIQGFTKVRVNQGDLLNPKMVDGLYLDPKYTCQTNL